MGCGRSPRRHTSGRACCYFEECRSRPMRIQCTCPRISAHALSSEGQAMHCMTSGACMSETWMEFAVSRTDTCYMPVNTPHVSHRATRAGYAAASRSSRVCYFGCVHVPACMHAQTHSVNAWRPITMLFEARADTSNRMIVSGSAFMRSSHMQDVAGTPKHTLCHARAPADDSRPSPRGTQAPWGSSPNRVPRQLMARRTSPRTRSSCGTLPQSSRCPP